MTNITNNIGNREIKFKAWDLEQKIMYSNIQDECLVQNQDGVLILGVTFGRIIRSVNMVVMQYTGLKDKNGKEIYEGDIVRVYNIAFKKYFNHLVEDIREIHATTSETWRACEDDGEIIGNVFENPDLLSQPTND